MKIVVAGGSGWIGAALSRSLAADGHEIVTLARSLGQNPTGRTVLWDGRSLGPWTSELSGTDAVVNLSGESIASGRWTDERKAGLVRSRIEPTSVLVEAMAEANPRPTVLVNASAVAYYGDRGDEPLTESGGPGIDFLAQLVAEWEAATWIASDVGMRVVVMRNAVVLGPGGGALPQLALPFRLFLGGPIGRGRQWFPWVHLDDVVGLFRRAIVDPVIEGPINVAAPEPVRMNDFAITLGQVLGRPSWLPMPQLLLRVALGELADYLVTSQRIVPEKAIRLGYDFKEPRLTHALERALRG